MNFAKFDALYGDSNISLKDVMANSTSSVLVAEKKIVKERKRSSHKKDVLGNTATARKALTTKAVSAGAALKNKRIESIENIESIESEEEVEIASKKRKHSKRTNVFECEDDDSERRAKPRNVPTIMTASTSDIHRQDSIPTYLESANKSFQETCKTVANIQRIANNMQNVMNKSNNVPIECLRGLGEMLNEVKKMLRISEIEKDRSEVQIGVMYGVVKDVEAQTDRQTNAIFEHMKQVCPMTTNEILVKVISCESRMRALSNKIGFSCPQAQPPTA